MSDISDLLPGFNCGRCGFRTCADFGDALLREERLELCPFLFQERFASKRSRIEEAMSSKKEGKLIGIVDHEEAQFSLQPLSGEGSCREDLFPFNRDVQLKKNEVIRYRPLGCPITHFARVLNVSNGILTVHIIGPQNLLGASGFKPKDIGICMVAAFEGVLGKGRMPRVCETVKFLPHQCMMGKVHSGVVVAVEGRKIRIEGIDLKVW